MPFQTKPLKPDADALKAQANAAFVANDFDRAITLYSEAIAAQPDAEVLYSNRSAAKLAKGDWRGALQDADRAIVLAPYWSKAFSRRAAALAAGGRTMGAIMAMRVSLKLEPQDANQARLAQYESELLKPRHESKPRRTNAQMDSIETCPDDVILAHARARVPTLPARATPTDARHAFLQHARAHPDYVPARRALYLPAPDEPASATRLIEIDMQQPGHPTSWAHFLKCAEIDLEFLYHEDAAEKMRGNSRGVGIGYLYRTYQLIMDDNANVDRSLNPEAATLLQRPNAHGPLLVMKVLHCKTHNRDTTATDDVSDVVAWEAVTKEELNSEEWQEMRAEFRELIDRNLNPKVAAMMQNSMNGMFEILPMPRRR